jgi:hypothetical protein
MPQPGVHWHQWFGASGGAALEQEYHARRTLLVSTTLRADSARVTPRTRNALVLGGGAVVLPLWPGRTFRATVLRVGNGGAVVELAGCELGVRLAGDVHVTPGAVVVLEAVDAGGERVHLRLR